jgi:hypothetical protein
LSEISPEERLWNLIRGALGTRAPAIAADLGIADALAGDPRPIADVARERGADSETLHLLLVPGNEPDGARWLDLLLFALGGGREQDETQWRALLDAGGFDPVSIEHGLIEATCR